MREYQNAAQQMEGELEGLLMINDMSQKAIQNFEIIVAKKDGIITDNLLTIQKITETGKQNLSDIKMVFFTKQKDLVEKMKE